MGDDDQEKLMQAQPQPVRRLVRRADDKMILGVAGGLADYFGVDPVLFRIGFVVAVFLGGVGILAYLLLAAILPAGSATAPSAAERGVERVAHALTGTPAWIGAALVALGSILVATQVFEWDGGVVWGLGLIILGVVLFVQRDVERPVAESQEVPTVPATPAATTAVLERTTPPGVPGAPPLPPHGTAPPPPPRRRRERSGLGLMTLGALLVLIGVITLLDIQGAITMTAGQYFATAVAVIGAGLLVGAFVGRARWLIVPGLILIPPMLAANLINVPFEGGAGDRFYRPVSVADLQPEYRVVAGEMTIDLTYVPFAPGSTYRVEATAVAGRIVVSVPENVRLDIRARTGAGEVKLFSRTSNGVGPEMRRVIEPRVAGGTPALLVLDLETGLGQVEVQYFFLEDRVPPIPPIQPQQPLPPVGVPS